MTSRQVLHLPAGAVLKRKTFLDFALCYGTVIEPSDGDTITISWEQETHPFFNDHTIDDTDDNEGWHHTLRWITERVPIYDKDYKTFWRNWKRVA